MILPPPPTDLLMRKSEVSGERPPRPRPIGPTSAIIRSGPPSDVSLGRLSDCRLFGAGALAGFLCALCSSPNNNGGGGRKGLTSVPLLISLYLIGPAE